MTLKGAAVEAVAIVVVLFVVITLIAIGAAWCGVVALHAAEFFESVLGVPSNPNMGRGLGPCQSDHEDCGGAIAERRVRRNDEHGGEIELLCDVCAARVLCIDEWRLPGADSWKRYNRALENAGPPDDEFDLGGTA